jgi:hypothetical protein
MRARHGPPESSRELGTLEHGSTLNEIRHSPEYCSAEQTFLLVRDSIPYIHDGEADDTTHMTSDLEIAYLNRNGPMSITYDLLLGTIVFNYHFDSGLVVNDDGKIVSVIDFTGKVLVLLTTADAQRCLIDRARVDAPGGLGKTNSRFARFVPVRFNSKIPDLFDQAAGWHKIVPEDFTLRLNAASLP